MERQGKKDRHRVLPGFCFGYALFSCTVWNSRHTVAGNRKIEGSYTEFARKAMYNILE